MRLNFITEHCFEAVRMFTLPTHLDHSIPKWTVLINPFHSKQDGQLETECLPHDDPDSNLDHPQNLMDGSLAQTHLW